MKTYSVLMALAVAVAVSGCGDDDNGNNAGGAQAQDQGAGDGQTGLIDRMGRAAITTATVGAFLADDNEKAQLRDRYNAARLSESQQFSDEIANSLAIYDALAGQCGDNELTATGTGEGTYSEFATSLAQDQLLINGNSGNCNQYLAVELGVTDQCGGRTPVMDVVDVTYSAVALGKTSGVTDGVSSDDGPLSNDDFPFLAAPESEEDETRFTVTVENVSQPGTLSTDRAGGAVPLSPGAYAVFSGNSPTFTPGQRVDVGTARIAEDGFPSPPLGTETATLGSAKQSGEFGAPGGDPDTPAIFPGETASFVITASPGDRLSIETMFVQSNDWFYGDDGEGIALFDDSGNPVSGNVTDQLVLWDAGSEQDTPPGTGKFQKPAQDPQATDVGPNENVPIRRATERHPDFDIPSNAEVIRVTITPESGA